MASYETRRVAMQAAPVAPAAPLLEVAGNGKLRVRFAAPPAEPACSEMAVYLRTIGAGVPWSAVNGTTKRLVEDGKGNRDCVPCIHGEVVVEGLCAGWWEARVCAMNAVSFGAASPTSTAVAVLGPMVPPAPSAPLLQAVGNGKLRVRFAAPVAEPACSETEVYLRSVGAGGRLLVEWSAVNGFTKRLLEKGAQRSCIPICAGYVVVQGLSAGSWEARLRTRNAVGFSDVSPVSSRISVEDDDDVAIVSSKSWADRDRELRKRAIDVDDSDVQQETRQETEHGRKHHRSKTPARVSIMGPLRQHNEDGEIVQIDDARHADDV